MLKKTILRMEKREFVLRLEKKLQLEKSNCRRRDKWKKLKIEVRQKK